MEQNSRAYYYAEALKQGKKEYSRRISKGKRGYLPYLEQITENVEIISEVYLGVVEVPLKRVVGTKSKSRSLSFASNFMPIMKDGSEFSDKWQHLTQIHVTEGFRDPVKVIEFMNLFYVVEGNKRISVLKYFNVYSYQADVTRIIPKYDENDINIRIYYEFLDFYKETGINNIWFSGEKKFGKLLDIINEFKPQVDVDYSKYRYFNRSVYMNFRKAYLELGGGALPITTGDAFLEYIRMYGILEDYGDEDVLEKMKSFISELVNFDSSKVTEIKTELEPGQMLDASISAFLSNMIKSIVPRKELKIAFVYARNLNDSSWTFSHEMGRQHIERVLQESVSTHFVDNVPRGDEAYEVMCNLAKDGYEVIFATSPAFVRQTLKAAIEFPQVTFLNCYGYLTFNRVSTYSGRVHETRFLLGLIAGALTKTNKIGYIGTYPIPEVLSGINAFTLGARMVNPYAVVKVGWTGSWDDKGRVKAVSTRLARKGIDLIAHSDTIADKRFEGDYGLMPIELVNGKAVKGECIASPVWNFGIFYEKIIRSILNSRGRNASDVLGGESKPINFWWGINSGILDFFYSKHMVPAETQKTVEIFRRLIAGGDFNPFVGPLYDRSGVLRLQEGTEAEAEEIMGMDYLVDGVEGRLPEMDRL